MVVVSCPMVRVLGAVRVSVLLHGTVFDVVRSNFLITSPREADKANSCNTYGCAQANRLCCSR